MVLSVNEEAVLDYLKTFEDCFRSPTEIGRVVGGGKRHSAWASPICKRLVNRGLVKRQNNGWYKAI